VPPHRCSPNQIRCLSQLILGSSPTRVTHLNRLGAFVLPPERRDDAIRFNPSPGKQDFFWGGRRGAEDAEKARIALRTEWRPARTKRPESFPLRVLCASASSPKKSCWLTIEREGPDIQGPFRSRCVHATGSSPRKTTSKQSTSTCADITLVPHVMAEPPPSQGQALARPPHRAGPDGRVKSCPCEGGGLPLRRRGPGHDEEERASCVNA
jgi:hypothetical protein